MAKVAVTKRDADKVFAAIKRQFAGWIEPGDKSDPGVGMSGPQLLKDFDWMGTGAPPYAIVWEGGPYDWALIAGQRVVDEEMTSLAREFDPEAVVWLKAVEFPDTIWVEAITGWALAIYPRDSISD